jgi:thymidine kinase
MKKGNLTVIAGPMFSGKTTKLLAMINVFERMGFRVLTVKPSIDVRYNGINEIHSHDHRTSTAIIVNGNTPEEIIDKILAEKPDKVIFDEIQFFDKEKIIEVVKKLKKLKLHVICAGLLYNYQRKPFGATADLIGLADESVELFAICQKCGSLARHSERLKGGRENIIVGAADKYIAVCERCHKIYK